MKNKNVILNIVMISITILTIMTNLFFVMLNKFSDVILFIDFIVVISIVILEETVKLNKQISKNLNKRGN